MTNRSSRAYAKEHLTLRGFQAQVDFEIIAQIHNQSARKRYGDSMTPIDAGLVERLMSTHERLRIAQIDQDSVGFIFVAGAGGPRLDEFGTIEPKSWLFIGPTCVPEHQGRGIEESLINWLVRFAQYKGIPRLIKLTRADRSFENVSKLLERAGFREKLRYYHVQLEMTTSPPTPRELPSELELVNFEGEKDFGILWSILEPAFSYLERDADAYEQSKATFGSMQAAYFPICLESVTGKPIGTIAMVTSGDRAHIATFGVIPTFQRRGIGSMLMERSIDQAWRLGVRTIDLSVRVENPQAISVYKRFGFQIVPERTTVVLLRDL